MGRGREREGGEKFGKKEVLLVPQSVVSKIENSGISMGSCIRRGIPDQNEERVITAVGSGVLGKKSELSA